MKISLELNLRSLQMSKYKKMNKIYEKATKMIESGFQTQIVSDKKIGELASKFPNIRVHVNVQGIAIRSKNDSWFAVVEENFITLYHKTMKVAKSRIVEVSHVQDVFYDLEFMFASIVSHDNYKNGKIVMDISDIKKLAIQTKVC